MLQSEHNEQVQSLHRVRYERIEIMDQPEKLLFRLKDLKIHKLIQKAHEEKVEMKPEPK